jgi:hypothetical protein
MWATVLVYFGAILLVFCLVGKLAERFLLRRNLEADNYIGDQLDEETCDEHGIFLCGDCFDFSPVTVLYDEANDPDLPEGVTTGISLNHGEVINLVTASFEKKDAEPWRGSSR